MGDLFSGLESMGLGGLSNVRYMMKRNRTARKAAQRLPNML